MAWRKGKRYQVNHQDFRDLEEMGYHVHQFTQYHYRVTKYGSETALDIFPTSRKYCVSVDGQMSSSKEYQDLLELVETKIKYVP